MVVLPVVDEWYAVEVTVTREVVAVPAVTVLPTAPDEVVGLVRVRGAVLPLFDTAALLGGTPRTAPAEYAVVVETGRGAAALTVSGLPESVSLPVSAGSRGTAQHVVEGADGPRAVTLLDVGRLFGTQGGP